MVGDGLSMDYMYEVGASGREVNLIVVISLQGWCRAELHKEAFGVGQRLRFPIITANDRKSTTNHIRD